MSWTDHTKLQPLRKRFTFVDIVLDMIDAYGRHRTGRNASLLAYMGILTMFPLLLVATTVLGLVLKNRPDLRDDIIDSAISKIPVVGPQLIENQGDISGNWWALAVGLVVALWGALRAFVALSTALDDIWEVHDDRRDNFAIKRLRALFGILAIGLAQIATVVLAILVSHADLPRKGQVLLIVGALALNVAVVASLYRFMTTRPMTWRLVWPGALMTGVLYTVLQIFGTKIMARQLANASEVYGAFGGLVALGFWISIHALVALIGGELNAALDRRKPSAIGGLAGSNTTEPTHLFVYGTLRPGDVRWPILQPFVLDEGVDDSVPGTVYDTGVGYPAAVFGGERSIRGCTYTLDPTNLDVALDTLDAEESSVPGGYTRVRVTTAAGHDAWAYAFGNGLTLTPIESNDWLERSV